MFLTQRIDLNSSTNQILQPLPPLSQFRGGRQQSWSSVGVTFVVCYLLLLLFNIDFCGLHVNPHIYILTQTTHVRPESQNAALMVFFSISFFPSIASLQEWQMLARCIARYKYDILPFLEPSSIPTCSVLIFFLTVCGSPDATITGQVGGCHTVSLC